MAYTVKQTATAAGVSPSTVRLWAREYQAYLSPGATPERGIQRQFTDDDIAVFRTIKSLRDSLATSDQIILALDNGERLETFHQPGQDKPGGTDGERMGSNAVLPLELLQAIVGPYKEQLQGYEARLQRLENELQSERAARLDAEKEASRLSGRLETVGKGDGQVGDKKSFNLWAWLKGEG